MRISDWSSDVCSSDLATAMQRGVVPPSPKAAARPPLPFRKWSASPLEARPKLFRGLAAASAITGGGAPVKSDGRAGGAARIVGFLFLAAALYGSGHAPPHSPGKSPFPPFSFPPPP